MKVTPDEYKVIVKYIYDVSGVTLESNKVYLVETRLGPLVKEHGCATFSEFYYKAKSDKSKKIEQEIINAITTQETLFFRDKAPFEVLQYKILPDLIDLKMAQHKGFGKIPIRIWSAACSTGQEAYSTAIVLKEMLPDMSKFDISIVGTDINEAAVAAASYGRYNQLEIDRGLPLDKLQRYFKKVDAHWQVSDELRVLTNFKKFNLFGDLKPLGKFDIVFCRNVAIYFSIDDRKNLFGRIADIMNPRGALLIGSSEYLAGICDRFESLRHIKTVYYQLLSPGATTPPARPAAAPAAKATAATPKTVIPSARAGSLGSGLSAKKPATQRVPIRMG